MKSMCRRFVSHSSLRLIEKTFNVDAVACEVAPNYNVAPTQEVLVIIRNHDTRLDKFYWGLVPFWAKDISIGSRLINARAETVAQKPSFRNAFKKRRCLIVADGLITHYLIKHGLGREGNPFLQNFVGEQTFLVIKVAGALLCALILWDIYKRRPKMAMMSSMGF